MSRDYPNNDKKKRYITLWKSFSGNQFGPNVEHVSMEYEKFFEFCAALERKTYDAGFNAGYELGARSERVATGPC